MATFTATANSNSTIGYAQYGSTTWNRGTTNGACQGAYQGTSASRSRVGVMVFSGAGAALKGKIITQITLQHHLLCRRARAAPPRSCPSGAPTTRRCRPAFAGSAQVGAALGTLTGKFYNNTVTHTLSATSNAALFEAMKTYFAEGNSALVLYNGETSSSSGYSSNYARVTSCTITVTYIHATVWYRDGSTWKQCTVWYRNGGAWVQVVPYYRNGGTWIRV